MMIKIIIRAFPFASFHFASGRTFHPSLTLIPPPQVCRQTLKRCRKNGGVDCFAGVPRPNSVCIIKARSVPHFSEVCPSFHSELPSSTKVCPHFTSMLNKTRSVPTLRSATPNLFAKKNCFQKYFQK